MELAPHHADARITLSSILRQLGLLDDALFVLNQESKNVPLDSQVLYKKCLMLLEQGLTDDFINSAKLLFRKHFAHIRLVKLK